MKLILGDCIEKLKELKENSVDAIVTDPPYGLGFMGKEWDKYDPTVNKGSFKIGTGTHPQGYVAIDKSAFQDFTLKWATECLRVLKPGGHLLSFGGTRTYHRMACAIEDAGFQVRDMVEWCYGQGFPKSLNIGKAVDKLRKVSVCCNANINKALRRIGKLEYICDKCGKHCEAKQYERELVGKIKSPYTSTHRDTENYGHKSEVDENNYELRTITKGTSEWEGWGTALKPSHEPIAFCRKPLSEKSVAENVLKWKTGGINIDESRVGTDTINIHNAPKGTFAGGEPDRGSDTESYRNSIGRFPANLIHDNSPEVRECFPYTKAGVAVRRNGNNANGIFPVKISEGSADVGFNDSGNASRFFKSIIYQAKSSKRERNAGCEELYILKDNIPTEDIDEIKHLLSKRN